MTEKNTITLPLRWYRYTQNNSGGYFQEPAQEIVVQAISEDEALVISERHGRDENASYCRCCGERWSSYCDEDTDEKPEPREPYGPTDKVPGTLFVYRDGTKEIV